MVDKQNLVEIVAKGKEPKGMLDEVVLLNDLLSEAVISTAANFPRLLTAKVAPITFVAQCICRGIDSSQREDMSCTTSSGYIALALQNEHPLFRLTPH